MSHNMTRTTPHGYVKREVEPVVHADGKRCVQLDDGTWVEQGKGVGYIGDGDPFVCRRDDHVQEGVL